MYDTFWEWLREPVHKWCLQSHRARASSSLNPHARHLSFRSAPNLSKKREKLRDNLWAPTLRKGKKRKEAAKKKNKDWLMPFLESMFLTGRRGSKASGTLWKQPLGKTLPPFPEVLWRPCSSVSFSYGKPKLNASTY